MTVAELIKELQKLDPDKDIYIMDNEYGPELARDIVEHNIDVVVDNRYETIKGWTIQS